MGFRLLSTKLNPRQADNKDLHGTQPEHCLGRVAKVQFHHRMVQLLEPGELGCMEGKEQHMVAGRLSLELGLDSDLKLDLGLDLNLDLGWGGAGCLASPD